MPRQYYAPGYGYMELPDRCVRCGAVNYVAEDDDGDGLYCVMCGQRYNLYGPMKYISEHNRDAGEEPRRRTHG